MTADTCDPTNPDSVVGMTLGPYQVCEQIGRGGMAVVYRAEHSEIRQPVAVKVLPKDKASDSWMLSRFRREAQATQGIHHAGVVQVFDYQKLPDGRPYMVMELVRGNPLRDHIHQSGMPISDAIRFGKQIAGALAAVHAAGVIHRDLKPENIMVVHDDDVEGKERCKVLDFGIAQMRGAENVQGIANELPGSLADQMRTLGLGTRSYMSPEHCERGAALDGRSDVYSLGIILHELLLGVRPFPEDEIGRRYEQAFGRQASLCDSRTDIPPALDQLIRRMLCPTVRGRPSMRDVVDQLERIGKAEQSPVVLFSVPDQAQRNWLDTARSTLLPLLSLLQLSGHELDSMVGFESRVVHLGSSESEIASAYKMAKEEDACEKCPRSLYEREQESDVLIKSFRLDAYEVTFSEVAKTLNQLPERTVRTRIEADEGERTEKTELYIDGLRILGLDNPHRLNGFVWNEGTRRINVLSDMLEKPATYVTWYGAALTCQQLHKRLPTEAEFEFAARGVEHRIYPWGNQRPTCDWARYGSPSFMLTFCKTNTEGGLPVRRAIIRDVTPNGVYDLGGNVAEWVANPFVDRYSVCAAGPCPDYDAASSDHWGTASYRAYRGGSWHTEPTALRAASRGRARPDDYNGELGFRCAR